MRNGLPSCQGLTLLHKHVMACMIKMGEYMMEEGLEVILKPVCYLQACLHHRWAAGVKLGVGWPLPQMVWDRAECTKAKGVHVNLGGAHAESLMWMHQEEPCQPWRPPCQSPLAAPQSEGLDPQQIPTTQPIGRR